MGEPRERTREVIEATLEYLPKDKPRYVMGVGTPEEIEDYAQLSVDMMDCVLPTRAARHGLLFTSEGKISIKNVPAEKRAERISDAIRKTSLEDRRHELIKRLSRGYKQRVGIAQALVHDPDVIILDEPTVGLDPKQIIEVRHLIKSLAGSHTIILSTHILPEVSMTCDRVVIINKGKIAAVDTPQNLTSQ